uniref:Cytochrome P450 n=1 Tax=Meloidogyne javanica TaxID=6303 RepID=A0A915LZ60_MELJA
MFLLFFGILLAFFQLLLFYNFYWKRRHLPPGPTPLPIVGNLLELGKKPPGYDIFLKWREEYGPIYTYWVGEQPMVAFTEYSLINETIEGQAWREHRKFLMNVFRNLVVGKNLLEQKVLSEFSAMCENIDKAIGECSIGEDMEIISHLDLCVGSIINSLLFGYQFHGEKTEEFVELKKILNEYIQFLLRNSSKIFLEVQRKIMRTYAFFKKQIEEHENDGEYLGDERLDFVSAFMREIKLRDGKENYEYG